MSPREPLAGRIAAGIVAPGGHMNRTLSTLALATGIALAALAPGRTTAAEPSPRTRVVFQVSDADPARWNLALNNARNVQQDLGKDNVDVEIVAYGPGIGMLRDDAPTEIRVTAAMTDGVRVVACENTMTSLGLKREQMIPGIGYVRAGVVELIRLQQAGWAYVRP